MTNYYKKMMLVLGSALVLSACSDTEADSNTQVIEGKHEQKEEDKYEKLVKEKNKELELEPLELTSYSAEVKATLSAPVYKEFYVNGKVEIEGFIENHAELKSDFVWIRVTSSEEGPTGNKHEYYAPIENGIFAETISFFNGVGEYRVAVQLPDTKRENYYYDTARFTVHNVSPESEVDLAYTPFGHAAGLNLGLDSGFLIENEMVKLSGEAGTLADGETLMLRLIKDSDTWQHVLPVENGEFSIDIPLFFGKGVHQLEVMVPAKDRNNYYQTATTLFIDNESERVMAPIEYFTTYRERGVTLESPQFGGEEAGGTYSVSGRISPDAEFGPETDHIYITSKKGEDEALDVIPVEDFTFDGDFHLRFGPGTYEVTLSVPEIKEQNSSYFRFFGFAKFEVDASAEDKRDLIPSRGVQSDAPEIIQLADELTAGKGSEREKGKAIYEYVARNVSYDVDKYKNKTFNWDDSALKTLDTKIGVCQDYAYLAIALMRAGGLEARYIEGKAGFPWPGNHAWVEAKLDGEWITMDPTWGSGYLQKNEFVAAYNEEYFDPDPKEFEKTHTRTGIKY